MKKFSFTLLAMAAALAITPAAVADSFSYTITGSNFTADVTFTTGNTALSVPGPGGGNVNAYLITNVAGTFDITGNSPINFTSATVANAGGANADNLADNGEFLFDNLLYPALPGNEVLDWGGVVFAPNNGSYYLNLFGGAFGSGAPDDTSFYFADNGNYHYNDPVVDTKNPNAPPPVFTPVPEPGTLFLLGTGLLGLAIIVFRKAGTKPAQLVLGV
jgi:hypothetical protein